MNIYHGRYDYTQWFIVTLNGSTFDPVPSQALVNHSLDGFSWSYSGSGPSQLALAILLNEFGEDVALENYMNFRDDIIARFAREDDWTLTSEDVKAWREKVISPVEN